MNNFIGTKIQQTQGFLENGNRTPITVVKANDLIVVGNKTVDKEGYNALVLGFGQARKSNKALMGIAKKANMDKPPLKIVEERLGEASSFALGDTVKVDEVLSVGDIVDVTGTSKGKGFAGGVKRYGFRGGPKTHGQSDRHRAPGSIGSGTTPGRVYRGKRMAGNMGKEQVTVKNLVVVDLDPENKTVMINGLIPGILGGVVSLKKVGEVKEKKFSPLFKIKSEEPVAEEAVSEPVIEDVTVSQPEVSQEALSEPEAGVVPESEVAEAVAEENTSEKAEEASSEENKETEAKPEEEAK